MLNGKMDDQLSTSRIFNNSCWILRWKMNRRDSNFTPHLWVCFFPLSGPDLNVIDELNLYDVISPCILKKWLSSNASNSKLSKSSCNLQIALHPPFGCHSFSGPWNYIPSERRKLHANQKTLVLDPSTRSRAPLVIMNPKRSCGDSWVM